VQQQVEEDDIYQEPVKCIVRPDNQLNLTDAQLKEEITRVLTGDDPNVPRSISKFNYKDRCFKPDPPGQSDHMAVHFASTGCLLHKDSKGYEAQKKREEKCCERKKSSNTEEAGPENGEGGKVNYDHQGGEAAQLDSREPVKSKFNYATRGAQMFNQSLQSRGISTEPPPVKEYGFVVSQWEIHDSYMNEYSIISLHQSNTESNSDKRASLTDDKNTSFVADGNIEGKEKDIVHSTRMERSLKVLERLVNQNSQDEIFQDFKYWEDASDQHRDGRGSLLPLWRFSTDRTKRKQVTALAWNPRYIDLFAVGYGSYDFMRQCSGMICCFSLKNTSFPESIFSMESGVMCLDFHPQHPSLLAAGCYDGSIMVYNVCSNVTKPTYISTMKTGKHTDPVWQVRWQEDKESKELNFFSISTDGRVAKWSMTKNELKMEQVVQLKLAINNFNNEPDEICAGGLAGGCCFDFSMKLDYLFLIGTEEGNIHKCSKAYSGQYLETYEGHNMPVYTLKWNAFHEGVFISCSADWTVKIWHHNLKSPVISFDLGNSVADVCWSPFSSTVFAAITSDGKVHVFDLAQNKHEPLCEQRVAKRAKLTRICFNERHPIVIVGDDSGGINSLKLSPNLRKLLDSTSMDGKESTSAVAQRNKLEKVLASIDITRKILD